MSFRRRGIDFEFEHNSHRVTVRNLIQELYSRACKQRVWWCVRHCAGMLRMRNESIAQSLIAILAQQKQLTIGLPPAPREQVLTSPMTVEQLYNTIVSSTGNDPTMVMLTQEILVFLHLFISTEPQLFAGMIRIRVGLIIQVMLGELKRTLQSSDEDTTDHLLNLSPYEIKCLLHIILSGKEFGITERSTKPAPELADLPKQERDMRIIRNEIKEASTRKLSVHLNWTDRPSEDDEDDDMGKHGQWIRRRRLDGALNRVPVRFYGQVWQTLEKVRRIPNEGTRSSPMSHDGCIRKYSVIYSSAKVSRSPITPFTTVWHKRWLKKRSSSLFGSRKLWIACLSPSTGNWSWKPAWSLPPLPLVMHGKTSLAITSLQGAVPLLVIDFIGRRLSVLKILSRRRMASSYKINEPQVVTQRNAVPVAILVDRPPVFVYISTTQRQVDALGRSITFYEPFFAFYVLTRTLSVRLVEIRSSLVWAVDILSLSTLGSFSSRVGIF